eukprot:gene6700-3369_t
MAFALAGNAHMNSQVAVPPGGLFRFEKDMLLVKKTGARGWGWRLMGFLQYDSWGGPAFIHRTIDKYRPRGEPKPLELISAPMPHRWSKYFLDHNNVGPTRGVPWDYVVPDSSFSKLTPDALSRLPVWVRKNANRHGPDIQDKLFLTGSCGKPGEPCTIAAATATIINKIGYSSCPDEERFLALWSMKESSLPIDLAPELREACLPVLREALGEELYTEYKKKGWLQQPTLRHLHADYMFYNMPPFSASQALPAWTPHFGDPTFDGPFAQVVRAAYAAAAWMRSSNATFPILDGSTE